MWVACCKYLLRKERTSGCLLECLQNQFTTDSFTPNLSRLSCDCFFLRSYPHLYTLVWLMFSCRARALLYLSVQLGSFWNSASRILTSTLRNRWRSLITRSSPRKSTTTRWSNSFFLSYGLLRIGTELTCWGFETSALSFAEASLFMKLNSF